MSSWSGVHGLMMTANPSVLYLYKGGDSHVREDSQNQPLFQ